MANVGKYRKKLDNLKARIKAFEALKNNQGYTKPGSQQGKL